MKIMSVKTSIICLLIAAVPMLTSCSKNSPKTTDDSIKGTKKIYLNFYDILIKNKSNPGKGLTEAKAYVNEKRYEMSLNGEILRKKLTVPEMIAVDDFNKELEAMGFETSKKIQESYSKFAGADNKILRMVQTLAFFHKVPLDMEAIVKYKEEKAKADKGAGK